MKDAKPEIRPWTAEQLGGFLTCRETEGDPLLAAWRVLAGTGLHRGELLWP